MWLFLWVETLIRPLKTNLKALGYNEKEKLQSKTRFISQKSNILKIFSIYWIFLIDLISK